MNIIVFILIGLVVIAVMIYISVRRSAVAECIHFRNLIFDSSLRGCANATDHYRHLHFLAKRFRISPSELDIRDFNILANEALNGFYIYISKAKHECLHGIEGLELKARIFRKEFFEDTSHSRSDEVAIEKWLTSQ